MRVHVVGVVVDGEPTASAVGELLLRVEHRHRVAGGDDR
jgi:hypothetical protein